MMAEGVKITQGQLEETTKAREETQKRNEDAIKNVEGQMG